jgi:nitrite reductase/ring-hydroxylating ferredoxin subunit/uncharacterized membrane protein
MRAVDELERAEKLDGLVGLGQRWARLVPAGKYRDTLYGVWLGHPLHPMLVQAPIGLWLSATVLDAWPDGERASRRLVLLGLAAAVPAALAGAADWSEQHEQQMRVGTVHAMANGAAAGLYAASLAARTRPASRVLRMAGLATAGLAGYLGGHLSYRMAGGANKTEPVPHLVQPGWQDLMPAAELTGSGPVRRMLGEIPVVVIRDGQDVRVLAEQCSHMSGPLSEGELDGGCLTCPWHGSVFRISDGAVVHGPATAPQPVFQARVSGGIVQVCLPGAG